MEINGLVHLIEETQEVGSNGFTKRLLVVETQEQYKQTIPIDFVKDKTALLDSYTVGDSVSVSINIRGNEYKGKYYANIQGWRIESVDETPQQEQAAAQPVMNVHQDDLPF